MCLFLYLSRRAFCLSLIVVLVVSFAPETRAQSATVVPVEHQLLNGLKVLISERPNQARFLMKLRIKSGAALDLAGKDGTIALLTDALTPEANTRQDIAEEMGGRFTVAADYDAIDFTIEGRAVDFERYVEILRSALLGAPPSVEAVDKLRAARSQVLRQTGSAPGAIADQAIAARLFGVHPYGRPAVGTVESLARVDRADVIFARERLLHPNNATLVVIGEIDEKRVMRTLRQLLGFWKRSENVAPATFKQPTSFDARTLIIDLPGAESTEIRLATRGFSQGNREAAAADLLAHAALERWRSAFSESQGLPLFVRHEARALGGIFTMGAAVPVALTRKAFETARGAARSLAATPLSPTELLQAKSEVRSRAAKDAQHLTLAANWLDADQFELNQNYDRLRVLDELTAEEVRQAAAKLFPDEHAAAIAVGGAAQLSAQLQPLGSIEVLGAAKAGPAAAAPPSTPPVPKAPPTRP